MLFRSMSRFFEQQVERDLKKLALLQTGHRVLAACSGGPDSVALVDVLFHLRDRLGFDMRIAHVNHGLRGEESLEDERFVITLAEKYDLPLTVRRFDRDDVDQVRSGNLEERARRLRYQKLIHTAVELDCHCVATGHTLSDQAETVLHRLLRAAGFTGLRGILPVRNDLEVPIVRPLLGLSRDQVLAYLRDKGLDFRHDAMNDDPRYTRVRIRKELMPFLREKFNFRVEEHLARLAELARRDQEFWDKHIQGLREDIGPATRDAPADRIRFLKLTEAEQGRLLRSYFNSLQLSKSWLHVNEALNLLQRERPQGEIHLSEHVLLYRRYDRFYFAPPLDARVLADEYPLNIPGVTEISALNIRIEAHFRPVNLLPLEPPSRFIAEFDADRAGRTVTVRTRREGDVMIPLGMKGVKKIKKILQEKRIPLEQRGRIPLICFDRDIAWVVGCCVSNSYRLGPDTQNVLRITVQPLAEKWNSHEK
ncbi:MAG TPA: tRNA lysidine(34) synthetase TilS [bacterium]|nr:tRNA lysidine(34) synthetase TilS [bacterium]HOL93755.1 tRNA lysidine(34) synthetase TilS [bacterium]HPP02626.1 tRNA lysidine(34) synthetase TilS [bacterium]HXK94649.1 tRNA lysidine(34) synthetase TilS [bacterium]